MDRLHRQGINAGMRGGLVRTGKPIDSKIEELAKENKIPIQPSWDIIESEIL